VYEVLYITKHFDWVNLWVMTDKYNIERISVDILIKVFQRNIFVVVKSKKNCPMELNVEAT
jgi:hypothetical protein